MSELSHEHIDNEIIDIDPHFIIDTITREISNNTNEKLRIMQYDNKSERYSFDMNRFIEGHDLMDCNKVQIHFINIGSSGQKHPGLYLVEDLHINTSDENKVTFSWLISQDATMFGGILSFLVSFKCIDGDTVLYRWSSTIYDSIQITAGLDNSYTVFETYTDELLTWQSNVETEISSWQHNMETELIPNLVDESYINREFATSEEVANIFSVRDPAVTPSVLIVPYEEVTDADIDALFNKN